MKDFIYLTLIAIIIYSFVSSHQKFIWEGERFTAQDGRDLYEYCSGNKNINLRFLNK